MKTIWTHYAALSASLHAASDPRMTVYQVPGGWRVQDAEGRIFTYLRRDPKRFSREDQRSMDGKEIIKIERSEMSKLSEEDG